MEHTTQNGPRTRGKLEQNQVVNEQEQQEKLNPGGEEPKENSSNTVEKNNQPGLMENKPGLEEGNNYEDDPKRGEN